MEVGLNYLCHLMLIRCGFVSEWMERHLSYTSPVGTLVELILETCLMVEDFQVLTLGAIIKRVIR